MSSVSSKIFPFPRRNYSVNYEIPERYSNSFYLANASFFDQVNWFLHRAYEISFPTLVKWLRDKEPKLNDNEATRKINTVISLLDQCNSIIDIRFPIQRVNGRKEIIRAFRAQYGLYSEFYPSLGGLRIGENITRDHMKALATLSTYKHACMGIRLAGGHGGIKVNPTQYAEAEMKQIFQKYAATLFSKGYCDGKVDIIEPDISVGQKEMAWLATAFPNNHDKIFVSGKPSSLGGIEHYEEMASQGVFFALDHFLNQESILQRLEISKTGLEKKTFIIQGLGNLGCYLARYLQNSGAICVGVAENDAYVYDPQGFDVESVIKHKEKNGSIEYFRNAKPRSSDNILKEQCDMLILASQQKSLICYIADHVKSKIIVEAANGAITPTAHRILTGRRKLVLPDIYVSSGHSVASYLEYLLAVKKAGKKIPVIRHLYKHILEAFEASERERQVVSVASTQKMLACNIKPDVLTYVMEHAMKETGNDLIEIANEHNLNMDLRIAGYIKAIRSLHEAIYEMKKY